MLVRFSNVVIALALALLPTACGSTPTANPCKRTEGSNTYSMQLIVEYANGRSDLVPLFLVCKPDNTLAIVDSNAQDYVDLDDFRANNKLFTEDDKITVPRGFPTLDRPEKIEWITVSGHTGSMAWLWWLIGGVGAALVLGIAALLWLRARRRKARKPDQTEPTQPEPGQDEPRPDSTQGQPGQHPTQPEPGQPQPDFAQRQPDPTQANPAQPEPGQPQPRPDSSQRQPGSAG